MIIFTSIASIPYSADYKCNLFAEAHLHLATYSSMASGEPLTPLCLSFLTGGNNNSHFMGLLWKSGPIQSSVGPCLRTLILFLVETQDVWPIHTTVQFGGIKALTAPACPTQLSLMVLNLAHMPLPWVAGQEQGGREWGEDTRRGLAVATLSCPFCTISAAQSHPFPHAP